MKLLRNLSIYTFVGFFGAGINFLLLPYLSHYLSPFDYGVLSVINSFTTILIPLIGLSASGWINVEYYKTEDRRQLASKYTSVQVIPILPFLLATLLCYTFQVPLAQWFDIPADSSHWFTLAAMLALFTIYVETLLNLIIAEQKPITYAAFVMARLVFEIGATVLLVTVFHLGFEGRLLAWLFSLTMSLVLSGIYLARHRYLSFDFSLNHYWSAIAFGAPLILHSVGKFVINQSDRIFIAKMVSLEEAGIYSIGYQLGTIVLIFATAAGNFFQPYLFERLAHRSKDSDRQIVKMTYVLASLSFILLIAVTALSPLLFDLNLIDNQYQESTRYIFWTGLSYFFWAIYLLMAGHIFFVKETSFLGYLAVANILVNVVLNYWLIGVFGALGAAYATCISFLFVAILVTRKACKLHTLPWI